MLCGNAARIRATHRDERFRAALGSQTYDLFQAWLYARTELEIDEKRIVLGMAIISQGLDTKLVD